MMHHVHTGEVVVTSQQIDIFSLVTTRLIVHSGQSQFLRNCVGEFSTDTAWVALGDQQRNVQLFR